MIIIFHQLEPNIVSSWTIYFQISLLQPLRTASGCLVSQCWALNAELIKKSRMLRHRSPDINSAQKGLEKMDPERHRSDNENLRIHSESPCVDAYDFFTL